MPRPLRLCAFASLAGVACPRPALPRRPYCHVHGAVQDAAGRVAGSLLNEMFSWIGGMGARVDAAAPSFDNRAMDEFFARLERELGEFFRQARAGANGYGPPPAGRRMLNYYKVLGVAHTADAAEIKAAFRRLAFVHHPDRNPGKPEAAARFKRVVEAYGVLSDTKRRAEYDALLRYARPVQEGA